MKTSDIMSLGSATTRENTSLLKSVETMTNHRISALPVVDNEGRICGILTEGDIVRAAETLPDGFYEMSDFERRKILDANVTANFMTHGAITIGPDATVDDAIKLMRDRTLKRRPVVADGKVLGVLSRADILRAMIA